MTRLEKLNQVSVALVKLARATAQQEIAQAAKLATEGDFKQADAQLGAITLNAFKRVLKVYNIPPEPPPEAGLESPEDEDYD